MGCNEELAHNNITHPMSTPNDASNNSSVQSNSNSEFSDIMADPPGCQNAPILKQSSSGSTPKPPRGLFPMITTDEDPYGPMAGHFYTNSKNQNTKIPNSQSVLTSPESRPPSCAYHSSKI